MQPPSKNPHLNEFQAVASWEDIITDPEIDAVVIGTWPYTHRTLVLAALQANKHVLTEARMVSIELCRAKPSQLQLCQVLHVILALPP